MKNKSVQQQSNQEILRQQLELLAERSKNASNEELQQITLTMIELHKCLLNEHYSTSFSEPCEKYVRIKLSNIRCSDSYRQHQLELLKKNDESEAIEQIELLLEHEQIII